MTYAQARLRCSAELTLMLPGVLPLSSLAGYLQLLARYLQLRWLSPHLAMRRAG